MKSGDKMLYDVDVLKSYIDKGFGKESVCNTYTSVHKPHEANLLVVEDAPCENITSYATLGMHNCELKARGTNKTFYIEMLAAAGPEFYDYDKVLLTVYSNFIKTKSFQLPGTCLLDAVRYSRLESMDVKELPHLYFYSPSFWHHDFKPITVGGIEVRFLMAFPISDKEYQYFLKYGNALFGQLLEDQEVNIFDLNRKSMIQ